MPRKKQELDMFDAFRVLADDMTRQARTPDINGYKPHRKQLAFHKSEDYIRLYIGGNRAGKTHGAVVEDIWWATNTHPYLTTPPPPVRIRVVVVDLIQGLGEIMLPKFKQLVRTVDLRGGSWDKAFSKAERKLYFANGSEIQFLTYEMDLEKFAGTSQHAIHFDEEPPKHIYNECAARIIDTEGSMWISMTPVEGITWVYEDLYSPVHSDPDREHIIEQTPTCGPVYRSAKKEITIVEVGMDENPYLSAKAQERFLSTLDPEERAARSKGQFVAVGGKVFKSFSEESHTIDAVPAPGSYFRGWTIYTSTDHGWNNPTAWLWHAVAPDGTIITFWEHYRSEMTIAEHSAIVKEVESRLGIAVDVRTGDPAMKQHSGISGTSVLDEYASQGLAIWTDSVPKDPQIGIAKMQQYFKLRGEVTDSKGGVLDPGKPTWFIAKNCRNLIRELTNLQWQKYESRKLQFKYNKQESILKKDDHAFDAAKYFATFLPDLAPDRNIVTELNIPTYNGLMRYDDLLVAEAKRKQEADDGGIWTTVETFD